LKCVRGKEAARNQFFCKLDLAGGERGGGRLGKGAVEQFVIEQLAGDLGEAVWGEDGNGKSDAIVGIVVRFGDGWREALAKFHKAGEVQNTEVASGVIIKEEDFSHGRVSWGGLIVVTAGDFLENLLYVGAR